MSPEYVLNRATARVLERVSFQRIVLKTTEYASIHDDTTFRKALDPLRKQGVRIAISDAGSGYSSFQRVLELEADMTKLGITLTQNIYFNNRKYLFCKVTLPILQSNKSQHRCRGCKDNRSVRLPQRARCC